MNLLLSGTTHAPAYHTRRPADCAKGEECRGDSPPVQGHEARKMFGAISPQRRIRRMLNKSFA